jgi:hypothetical protein
MTTLIKCETLYQNSRARIPPTPQQLLKPFIPHVKLCILIWTALTSKHDGFPFSEQRDMIEHVHRAVWGAKYKTVLSATDPVEIVGWETWAEAGVLLLNIPFQGELVHDTVFDNHLWPSVLAKMIPRDVPLICLGPHKACDVFLKTHALHGTICPCPADDVKGFLASRPFHPVSYVFDSSFHLDDEELQFLYTKKAAQTAGKISYVEDVPWSTDGCSLVPLADALRGLI